MAKPRIFVSSTFYDLRYARVSLEGFIREMGYEPVMNERGNIPYESEKSLEDYCYSEISKVSMLVSIIGGRFGTKSREDVTKSISNIELKTALDQGKQVYIFIESPVNTEYYTYLNNKGRETSYTYVDNVKIYNFIEEIHALPGNNQIYAFSEVPQIIAYLKEQWAGLLENYLEQKAQDKLNQSITRIESAAQTLNNLVAVLSQQNMSAGSYSPDQKAVLDGIVLQNHPIFTRLKSILRVPYRIFFSNIQEMNAWFGSRMLRKVPEDPLLSNDEYYDYLIEINKVNHELNVAKTLFDDRGNLLPMRVDEWEETMLIFSQVRNVSDLDDEIPF